jgi:hypothetical protein
MDPADAAAAFAAAADNIADSSEPPFAPATANRQADAANQSIVVRFARMVYLSGYVQALVTQTWPIRSDATMTCAGGLSSSPLPVTGNRLPSHSPGVAGCAGIRLGPLPLPYAMR